MTTNFTFTLTQEEFAIVWGLLQQGNAGHTRVLMNKLESNASEQINAFETAQAEVKKAQNEAMTKVQAERVLAEIEARRLAAAAAKANILGPAQGFVDPNPVVTPVVTPPNPATPPVTVPPGAPLLPIVPNA